MKKKTRNILRQFRKRRSVQINIQTLIISPNLYLYVNGFLCVQERCRNKLEEQNKLEKEIMKIREELQSLDYKNSSLKKQTEVYSVIYNIKYINKIILTIILNILYIFFYIHINLNLKSQC